MLRWYDFDRNGVEREGADFETELRIDLRAHLDHIKHLLHFATGYRTIEDSFHMFQQNNFFRENALGNFKQDLVRGIIHDPAMIKYLNNYECLNVLVS